MENLINEIKKLAMMKNGSVLPIRQGNDIVYLNKSIDGYAIAIPFNDERTFNETFVGISLLTNTLNYDNKSFKVLYLFMTSLGDLDKFAYIGAEFIDVKNREGLLLDPYQWVDAWKEMFGDSKKKYIITDVLAELIALREVFSNDKTAKWEGPNDGTHDIVLKDKVVEVKSTTNKTNNYVSINSRFQLNPALNEELYFIKLETKPYALSIDSIVDELVSMGYPATELEDSLKKMGYEQGSRNRKRTYNLLSMTSYKVNEENFPIVSLESINNLTKSKNIVGFKLTVDLSTIPGKTLV